MTGDIDLASDEAVLDPAGYFGCRWSAGPVQWSEVHRAWVVLGHREVSAAFRDAETLSADKASSFERMALAAESEYGPDAFAQVLELLRGWMVFRDPPAHTRLRQPVRRAFTPGRVDDLSAVVAQVVDDVVEALPDGWFDVSADFAAPLPALVIAAVLGVEGAERRRFQHWSDELATVVFSTSMSAVAPAASIHATEQFTRFFGELIEAERARQADGPPSDGLPSGTLLSAIVAESRAGEEGLSPNELVSACTLLLFAGHETTAGLLANAVGLLVERPDLARWWRQHPEADAGAVEELLRVLGPARTLFRQAVVDHERGGRSIRAGDTVALAVCAANHDPSVFVDPGRVDLTRDPNPQLTFGWGLHHCLGAHLARLEARLALRALLDRFEDLEPDGPVPPLTGTVIGCGRDLLRVRGR